MIATHPLPGVVHAHGTEDALRDIAARLVGESPISDRYLALRHSAHVIRTFPRIQRALRQLTQHASFASIPEKRAGYREALGILTRHTGETLADTKPSPAEAAAARELYLFT